MPEVILKKSSPEANAAIQFICNHDEKFGELIKEMTVTRAVQVMLFEGPFSLPTLHKNGDMRIILDAFL